MCVGQDLRLVCDPLMNANPIIVVSISDEVMQNESLSTALINGIGDAIKKVDADFDQKLFAYLRTHNKAGFDSSKYLQQHTAEGFYDSRRKDK